MKTIKNAMLTSMMAVALFSFFTSCDDSDDKESVDPISAGSAVQVRNTFESEQFSAFPGFEIYVNEAPFGDTLTSTTGTGLEFEKYLGLYDINIGSNTINYELTDIAPENITFRTIEAGTFDRYYIKFGSAQAFKTASVDDEFVSVSILSDTEIKVEIGEGYNFMAGHSFMITLK